MGISIYKVDTELQKERKKNEVLINEHPRILDGIELFVLPLTDSIGDLCYDKRHMTPTFSESNAIITVVCPLDSNRRHMNIQYLGEKE